MKHRLLFLTFLILCLPIDSNLFIGVFHNGGTFFQYLFRLTAYTPHFTGRKTAAFNGAEALTDLLIVLLIALAGSLIWTWLDSRKPDHVKLNEWLRTAVRYRLGLALVGYGLPALFSLQMPYPALSDLHTRYGDLARWKIYYLSTGIGSDHYAQSLGALVMLAALLLLFRKTATAGAALATALLVNIVLVNFAYHIGDQAYSVYLLILALFLLAYDIPRLVHLLALERFTKAAALPPPSASAWVRKAVLAVRVLTGVFIIVYAFSVYAASRKNWPFSSTPGLAGRSGYYNVSEFIYNGVKHPYSASDTVRWRDVVLEPWNTISIATSRSVPVSTEEPLAAYKADLSEHYEQAGNGGRLYYSYDADTAGHTLVLRDQQAPADSLRLIYSYPDAGTILLSGVDGRGDTLHVRLDRVRKRYLLKEGSRKPLQIN